MGASSTGTTSLSQAAGAGASQRHRIGAPLGEGERAPLRPRPSEPRMTLHHPAFWAALALLLLNDHVLKGAGLLPSDVTGKLSDVAGLVVAPWLAVALLDRLKMRSRRARALAFALVVLPFAMMKASPSFAASVDATMSAAGLAWRTWSDPTDLLALAVLPLTWQLSTPQRERHARSVQRGLERAGILFGAAACLATSRAPGPPTVNASGWLLNRTGVSLTLRVRPAEASLDCASLARSGALAAPRDAFGEGVTMVVPANAIIALGRAECQVVLIEGGGLEDIVVVWASLATRTLPTTLATGDDGDTIGRVTLEERDGVIVGVAGIDVQVGARSESPSPSLCATSAGETAEWAPRERIVGAHRIAAIDEGADGCLALRLVREDSGEMRTLFLCVPPTSLPFVAGARVAIEDAADPTGSGAWLHIAELDGEPWARTSLDVFAGVERMDYRELQASVEPAECASERTECGALVVPAMSEATHAITRATLRAGEVLRIDAPVGDEGVRAELLFLGGARVVFAPATCDAESTAVGVARGDFVLTTFGSAVAP